MKRYVFNNLVKQLKEARKENNKHKQTDLLKKLNRLKKYLD